MSYQNLVRPKYVELMHALGLYCQFHRAEAHILYTRDHEGNELAVMDCLGGYGAALFGHNPRFIIQEATSMLQRGIPFHAQLSIREEAGLLAAELIAAINAESGSKQKWIASFSNSGAEAVEVAIKHAEYARHHKLESKLAALEHELHAVEKAWRWREVSLAAIEDLPVSLIPSGVEHIPLIRLCELIRAHNLALSRTPPVFLALRRSFHGKLVTTIQATHGRSYREPYGRFGLTMEFIDPAQPESWTRIINRHQGEWLSLKILSSAAGESIQLVREAFLPVAGLLVEPVQGEGGIHSLSVESAREIRRFCNIQAIPLIVDEIQSGFGRTGYLLASSSIGLLGDTVCLSKALGGSLAKIAVTLIRAEHYQEDFSFTHSSTFAEDDWGCRIARKALERLLADDGAMLQDIRTKGELILTGLNKLQSEFPDVIKEVRGKGLLIGIELNDLSACGSVILSSAQYNDALGYIVAGYLLQQERIRVAPSASNSNVLRLEPPACIPEADISRLLDALARVCILLRSRDLQPIVISVCREGGPSVLPNPAVPSVPAPVPVPGKPRPGVAFVNHLIDTDMLSEVEPSLIGVSSAKKQLFVQRMTPERRSAPIGPIRIRSALGSEVDFTLYPLCTDSETMIDSLQGDGLERMRSEIAARVSDARSDGCSVAGLGMYTSILTNNCLSIKVPDIALTSGNALTIGMGLEAIRQVSAQRALNIHQATVSVVGAAGNIASTYAALLSEQARQLWLLGSAREGSTRRLYRTAARIYAEAASVIHSEIPTDDFLAKRINEVEGARDFIAARMGSVDLGEQLYRYLDDKLGDRNFIRIAGDTECLKHSQIVVCAANAPHAFLGASDFAEGAVVCDIAVPLNVEQDITVKRPDVAYLHGGVVRTPFGDGLPQNVRAYLQEGEIYACMAESMLMGLTGTREHYSYGDIDRDQVRRIMALAQVHGFTLGGVKRETSL